MGRGRESAEAAAKTKRIETLEADVQRCANVLTKCNPAPPHQWLRHTIKTERFQMQSTVQRGSLTRPDRHGVPIKVRQVSVCRGRFLVMGDFEGDFEFILWVMQMAR